MPIVAPRASISRRAQHSTDENIVIVGGPYPDVPKTERESSTSTNVGHRSVFRTEVDGIIADSGPLGEQERESSCPTSTWKGPPRDDGSRGPFLEDRLRVAGSWAEIPRLQLVAGSVLGHEVDAVNSRRDEPDEEIER